MEKLLVDLGLVLGLFGLLTSGIYGAMVLAAAARFRRRSRLPASPSFTPPVSLLKPLHGAEPGLDAHLGTFFEQDYPAYEILFCARYADDAGLTVARRVAARYPHVPVQFLTTGEPNLPNAKILSLEHMALAARHDIFIISDSDVRVAPDYVHAVVAPFADANVGAVTCLYRGVAVEGGLWSRLEATGMSIEMTSGVLVAEMLEGMKFALGPTMAVRRSCVQKMGGFLPMGDYCSDDFLLGNWVAEQGSEVVLSHHVIDHVVLHADFRSSMQHQARWMKSTRFSRPKGHFGTLLTFCMPFGLLAAMAAFALHWPWLGIGVLAWSIGSRMALAAAVSQWVLRESSSWQSTLLYPLRDLMGFFFWLASYGSRKILWRGEVYVLEPGGRMRSLHSIK
ncbi:MAG TPA: bacteriohopanetetrol glucosamine biosynthesis glycosyltransferase HpnI [Acidobacteriaceae bacterium]|nr:bacteriohopanetetrol glucosamine biosynthesis glycosyltransferase HpnI [Acidobacteriaceae bacterium]